MSNIKNDSKKDSSFYLEFDDSQIMELTSRYTNGELDDDEFLRLLSEIK